MSGRDLIFESELLAEDYLRSDKRVRVQPEHYSLPVSAHHLVFPRGFAQFPRVSHFCTGLRLNLEHLCEAEITLLK